MRRIFLTAALTVLLGAAPARACDFGFGGFGYGGGFGMQQSFSGFGGLGLDSFAAPSFGGSLGGYGSFGAQSFAVPVFPRLNLNLNFQSRAFAAPNFAFRGRVRGRSFAPGFGGNLRFRGRVRGGFGGFGGCPSCFP